MIALAMALTMAAVLFAGMAIGESRVAS